MTTKEIIEAFRAGKMPEEEAVRRLVSLYRQTRSSGVKGEISSPEHSAPIQSESVGNLQPAPVALASGPSRPERGNPRAADGTIGAHSSAHSRNSGRVPCDIAVIGMSGRFPDAPDVEQFWKNLVAGRDSVREVPKSRWDTDKYFDPNPAAPAKSYSKWAGLLEDIEYFDPLFFNISPLEAEFMDPQQRLLLQEAWHAFEDAGYGPKTLSGKRCGVFVGVSSGDYQFLLMEAGMGTDAYVLLGNIIAILAGRIGYSLNLKGPSISIDTASSSSLVAVHHACQSIRTGESEMALAAGVAILATPYGHILTAKTGALSRTGKCHTFDQSADGFVPSEGAAAIVLKPLDKALEDGDHIYGVIKGSACNQDGSTNGITAPSSESQKNLQLRVYRDFGIDPSTVTYVECHGTGTKLGDPIEIGALTESFRAYTSEKQFCAIGSSKTNVGHALAACGIIGLIKVLLCLDKKQIPASLHFNNPNRHINFDESPFYVNTKLRSWDVSKLPRRAAINSFGISGTNAHVVLEEFIPPAPLDNEGLLSDEYVAVPVSARSEPQLKEYAGKILAHMEQAAVEQPQNAAQSKSQANKLQRIAYTLQTGRIALNHRLMMVVRSWEELKTELRKFVYGGSRGPNTWVGNTEAPADKIDLSTATVYSDRGTALDRLVSMAKSWVAGRDVDWISIYPKSRPERISLPTYPFARERYWLRIRESSADQGRNSEAGTTISSNGGAEFLRAALQLSSTSASSETKAGVSARNSASHSGIERPESPLPAGAIQIVSSSDNGLRQPVSGLTNSHTDDPLVQPAVPRLFADSYPVQSLSFLRQRSTLKEAGPQVDWAKEMEKHRGEKVLFFYQRDQDLTAVTEVLRQCERALNIPELFQCSYIKMREGSSSVDIVPPSSGTSVQLGNVAEVTDFLHSFENTARVPDAFFFLPEHDSGGKSITSLFFLKLVHHLLRHAPNHPLTGYYCHGATGDLSEFHNEGVAAEVNALTLGNMKHCYRWIKMPARTPEYEKAAALLRERLAYPVLLNGESVEYQDGRRMVRSWEKVVNQGQDHGPRSLRSGGTYLITGNPGDLGLSLSKELSQRYQARIVIAPQDALSENESSRLAALQRSGVKIHCVADCTDERAFKEAVTKTAAPIADIRGVIDLGAVGQHRSAARGGTGPCISVVEKDWKPKPLANSITPKLKGNCAVLVNATSLRFVEGWLHQVVEGKIVMLSGEEVHSPDVRIMNWADMDSGRKAAERMLSEMGELDYIFDVSDLYTEPRSSDASQYGRIGFYQEVIARYRDLTILYFTRGLQSFQSQWTTMAGARRAGFMKMLSAEYNHVRAKCIDVDSEFLGSSSLPWKLAAEALAAMEETEICYRSSRRLVPYLKSRSVADRTASPQSQLSVRPNGAYVISGGTNGIGLEIAAHFAACGAKNLALMGITSLPPQSQWRSVLNSSEISAPMRQKLEKLLHIQSMGVDLDIHCGRLIEREQLTSFLRAFRSKVGRIDGVVHSAGCAPDLSMGKFAFINKSQADLQRVFEPKIDGLEALAELLSEETPDFFVTFSSMASIVPSFGKGISDYAAANAFVDDFVSYQLSQGRKYFRSMAWVGWSDVGMHRSDAAVAAGHSPERRAAAVGLLFNSSEQGIDLFEASLRDQGQRSHQMPCLFREVAFQTACDTLLWARPAGPDLTKVQDNRDFDADLRSADDLKYLLAIDDLTQQTPLDFFVLLSPLHTGGTEGRTQAYQNGFHSAFANRRNAMVAQKKRHGSTLSLWAAPWKSDTPTAADSSRFDAQAALSSIEAALAQDASSMVVSDGNTEDIAVFGLTTGLASDRQGATSRLDSAAEALFEEVVEKLRRTQREARSQILLELNLDGFSDRQIELLHALVFEKTDGSDLEASPVVSGNAGQSHDQDVSLQEIKAIIDAELKQVLRLANATVSERGSFQQYGLDSISGMQLVSRLEKTLGLEIPPRWLIEYGTIETLSGKIVEQQRSAVPRSPQPKTTAAKATTNGAKQASEQEVSLQEIKAIIDAELKQILRLENATVSERGSFQQYGLDSISGMQLVSRLEKMLALEIPPRWLIEYGTIETLSGKIAEQQQSGVAGPAR